MLKLKLQYFGHLMQRADSLKETLTEDEMVGWHHWLNRHESEQTQEIVKGKEAWRAAAHGAAESDRTEQQQQNYLRLWRPLMS